jgi:CspA family cold shock protein
MKTGTIKFFDTAKGFGFIRPDEPGQADVYLHRSALEWAGIQTLERGDRVSYEVRTSHCNGKNRASDLRLVSAAE